MRHQRYSQEFIAILGSLVVLSVFMLVFGVATPMAQTGQDDRCADYTEQAHGLCTAAVANGCFDGAESQACENLTRNWNERCGVCEGPAPWGAQCPCAADGTAVELNELFLQQEFDGSPVTDDCPDDPDNTSVFRVDSSLTDPVLAVAVGQFVGTDEFVCVYQLTDGGGQIIVFLIEFELQPGEVEACREDIRKLMAEFDDCPHP
jgi:hypothetical protein